MEQTVEGVLRTSQNPLAPVYSERYVDVQVQTALVSQGSWSLWRCFDHRLVGWSCRTGARNGRIMEDVGRLDFASRRICSTEQRQLRWVLESYYRQYFSRVAYVILNVSANLIRLLL